MLVPNLSQIQTGVIGSFIPAFVARLRLPSGWRPRVSEWIGRVAGEASGVVGAGFEAYWAGKNDTGPPHRPIDGPVLGKPHMTYYEIDANDAEVVFEASRLPELCYPDLRLERSLGPARSDTSEYVPAAVLSRLR